MRRLLALALLFALACAGVGPTEPVQTTPLSPQTGTTPVAQPVAQPAYAIQGPLAGDDGALLWADTDGRLTGVYPSDGILMFGMNGQLVWTRDAFGGWYAVQGDQLVPLAGMPPELATWPGVQTALPGGYVLPAPRPRPAAPSGGYAPAGGGGMVNINDLYHDTSMEIIGNLPDGRAGPVTDHYNDDGTYAGSW